MKFNFSIIFFLFFAVPLLSQTKNDFTWILGYASLDTASYYADTTNTGFLGGNHISFHQGNPEVDYFKIRYEMEGPAIMSDEGGNLLFYSNGCNIMDRTHYIMDNGDGLNPGYYQNYCSYHTTAYLSYQALLALPIPDQSGQYLLFHIKRSTQTDTIELLVSYIDMDQNNGLGKVTSKNNFLQADVFSKSVIATRHANGRDWWIVTSHRTKSYYYVYLLDPEGLHPPIMRYPDENGWILGHIRTNACAFSPDGSKFVRTGMFEPPLFRIYDFDRCTGDFSNPRDVAVPDSDIYAPWVCFSPNSRYLYYTNYADRMFQFDTEAADISASGTLIGTYDGFLSVHNLPTAPYSMALGPDQRIYMGSGNGANVLHTINYPDRPGLDCLYKQHNVTLPAAIVFTLPNYPNYRLYNLPGSSCDTLNLQTPMESYWRWEQDSLGGASDVSFTDLSYHEPVTWHWDFGDGTSDYIADPYHHYTAPGTYTACLTACNTAGICDTTCHDIVITTVHTWDPGVVVSGLKAFPNPTTDFLSLVFDQPFSGRVQVTDVTGKGVFEENALSNIEQYQISVRKWAAGVYVLSTESVLGERKMLRFLVGQ